MTKLKHNFVALAIFMVAGLVLSGSANAACKHGEQRTTITGAAAFTCDTSHPALGEAWSDPKGLIWGDTVKNEDGSVWKMVQSSKYMKERGEPLPGDTPGAKEYCESIGARLPSRGEFMRLRYYMEVSLEETKKQYFPQILPNLESTPPFWSSTIFPTSDGSDSSAYNFDGNYGIIDSIFRPRDGSVRCVVGR